MAKQKGSRLALRPTPGPWDAGGITVFYAARPCEDAIPMREIRANVTEHGWDTVAFVEAAWPSAKVNARLIASAPKLLDALLDIKGLAQKSGDQEAADPFTLLDLILDEALAAIQLALKE